MTSSPVHQSPPPDLQAWLEAAAKRPLPQVLETELDGIHFVVKRRRASLGGGLSYVLRYLRAFFLGLGCKLFLGEFPRPGVLLRNGLDFEAQRLRVLLADDCRVPAIWHEAPGLLVLEHVGEDLSSVIRHGSAETRSRWARLAGRDLAEFHRRGHCHGGAQIRNLTIRNDELWRIDFEENIGEALSPPLAQAYDLFQLVASLVSLRKLPAEIMPGLARDMVQGYFEVNPDARVRDRLARLGRVLGGVARLLRPLLGRLSSRDVQGFFRVADLLRDLTRTDFRPDSRTDPRP
ncbi:hypothetical protein CAL29_09715 [Bordetella genomosp. 10]|uniref:Serine/threonine protein kinase n=1 Tax=Bordetella genomosp. 10 TaxID=1416804 RepID=A0A261SA74_9BORD|nr:hypothetical protein [Bordetella genomosp. 10]OZI33852.1 hypothetical protein CAL29_09715 [Bordetella genomosp. 10]